MANKGLIGVQMSTIAPAKMPHFDAYESMGKLADIGYHCVEISQVPMTAENVAGFRKAIDELGLNVSSCTASTSPMLPGMPGEFLCNPDDYKKIDLNLGLQLLAGFLSRFRHGWSLLSVRRHRKRTVDLLGCPDGSIKFSWGYPLKELRSSAPLFISSWIMVAKSFFTLSLSVFAPAFSTYTVLSPNLKVA